MTKRLTYQNYLWIKQNQSTLTTKQMAIELDVSLGSVRGYKAMEDTFTEEEFRTRACRPPVLKPHASRLVEMNFDDGRVFFNVDELLKYY